MEISDENIFDQKLKSEEMNHMMLWRKTISGREKSKNKDILKFVACVGIGQIISVDRSLAFSFKPGSQRKHLSK